MADVPTIVMMHGLTGTGKSTLAARLGAFLTDTDALHTAVVRSEMELTPEALANDREPYRFSLEDPTFSEVSRVVYGEMVRRAKVRLSAGRRVILDGSFSVRWERDLVYDLVRALDGGLVIISCRCEDEEIIRGRLKRRERDADPFSEAPDWDTYVSLRDGSDPLMADFASLGFEVWLIEYETCSGEVVLKRNGRPEVARTAQTSLAKMSIWAATSLAP